jgi:hypothetical protein
VQEGLNNTFETYPQTCLTEHGTALCCAAACVQVKTVVDHFHFKSHKGGYCHTQTNPYSHKELNGGANLWCANHGSSILHSIRRASSTWNQARFNFMLAMVVWIDHQARRDGLL